MGTLTYLFLLALILGHRRPRFFERILFFLALSLFLIYSGGLLEMNARIQYASPPEATRLLYTSLITLGMLFLPALLVHVHLRFLSLLRPSALPRWCWVIVYLFYAFPLTYLLVPILLFHGLPSLSLKSLLHWFRPDDLSVLILAVLVCAASDYNITRTSADPTTRRFFRLLGLASVLVLVPLALWQGFATLAPMQGEGTVVAIVVAGIFPGALLIYFALRHNFLEFGGQRNLVYALSAAFLSLLYLALVRRVSGWLEPVLPPEATASILLFVLVFAFEPLQRSIGRALQRTVHLQMERVQRLSGELQMEARRGDVESLLAFAERRICDEFGLASATITLTAPPSVHASQASVTAGPKVRLLLRKGGEEIGTLDAVAHGAFISGDARAALEFLAEQLPAAIDLCRLIEEKLSLERELAERERLALVGQMAASISHNLRNPLSSMKTVLQVLLEKPDLSETVRHDCALVVGEIDRLSAKLGQLLRFAKSSARTPPEQQKRVDLASLVDQVVTLTQPRCAKAPGCRHACAPGKRDVRSRLRRSPERCDLESRRERNRGGARRRRACPRGSLAARRACHPRNFGRRSGYSRRTWRKGVSAVFHDEAQRHGPWPRHRRKTPGRNGRNHRLGKSRHRRTRHSIYRDISTGHLRRCWKMRTLLIVDDEPTARYGLRRALEHKYRIAEAANAAEARAALPRERPDVVLLDLVMPEEAGLSLLRWMRENGHEQPVLVVSALDTAKTAVEALQLGAADYIVKGFDIEELRRRVANLIKLVDLSQENARLRRELVADGQFGRLLGTSAAMRRVFELTERVAPTDATVLILGESGTGKDLLAQEIHDRSPRAGRPFVAVNCAALPENLIESELFGYEKGAFTGAAQQRKGKFELASGGTLFLDEIGDMNPVTQAKVLRALENRRIERLGAAQSIAVDVRVISATHRDLPAEIAAGKFREDLFYRLRVVTLELPPLRSHKEDIPLLASAFLAQLNARHEKKARLEPAALELLSCYDWPGNVRELRNAIERSLVLATREAIGPAELPEDIRSGELLASPGHPAGKNDLLAEGDFRQAKRHFEIAYLKRKLEEHHWNVSRTAAAVGLHRQSLQEKLRELGIQRPGK
jgi:DNA-binding NtrC family response regulator/signal transduction histidine kinase